MIKKLQPFSSEFVGRLELNIGGTFSNEIQIAKRYMSMWEILEKCDKLKLTTMTNENMSCTSFVFYIPVDYLELKLFVINKMKFHKAMLK